MKVQTQRGQAHARFKAQSKAQAEDEARDDSHAPARAHVQAQSQDPAHGHVPIQSPSQNQCYAHAHIRPTIQPHAHTKMQSHPARYIRLFKLADETVTPVPQENVVHDNLGVGGEKEFSRRGGMDDEPRNDGVKGQTPPPPVFQNINRNYQPRRVSNAYMLQYLIQSGVDYFLCRPKDEDVPKELSARIMKYREEEKQLKRYNTEQHL